MQRKKTSFVKVWMIARGLFVTATLLGVIEIQAAPPEAIHAVVGVQSVEKPVEHAILLGNAQNGRLRKKIITGPTELVVSVVSDNCLVGYSIANAEDVDKKQYVSVWTAKEPNPIKLVVGEARVVLLPGMILKDGTPHGKNQTEVYEVRDVIENASTQGKKIIKIGLPVEYRHHFEKTEPTPNSKGYVFLEEKIIYEVTPQTSVVDDFGVHRITCQPSEKLMQTLSKYEFHN